MGAYFNKKERSYFREVTEVVMVKPSLPPLSMLKDSKTGKREPPKSTRRYLRTINEDTVLQVGDCIPIMWSGGKSAPRIYVITDIDHDNTLYPIRCSKYNIETGQVTHGGTTFDNLRTMQLRLDGIQHGKCKDYYNNNLSGKVGNDETIVEPSGIVHIHKDIQSCKTLTVGMCIPIVTGGKAVVA